MTHLHGAPRPAVRWKARALHHDADRFLRAPGCHDCIDRDQCGGIHTRCPLLDCMEHCCNKPDTCQWMCHRNPHFLSQLQEIGGFSLDNIHLDGPALAFAPLPAVVPLIYHGYRRARPLDVSAAAIKLAQLFHRRSGAPRFTSREQLCRRFALSPSATLVTSGVDDDPYIEPWWGIGQPRRLAVVEVMKAIGIALVTSPNFSLSVNWPRG